MTKKIKAFLAIFLCSAIIAVTVLSFCPIAFAGVKASGSCDSVNWVLDETGTLTINGTGEFTKEANIEPYLSEIKQIIVNPGITSIGRGGAFAMCSNLESVELPEGLEVIRGYTFCMCKNLSKINLPESLITIGGEAFEGCTSLKHISLPKNLEVIGARAFSATALEEITIPSKVTTIDMDTFLYCSNLKKVVLPDTVEVIDAAAFDCCSALEEIILPPNIKSLSTLVFRGCTSLKSLVLPDGIEEIGIYAIDCCTSLSEITIPSSVKSIGMRNFENCTSLTEINYFGTKEQWEDIDIDISEEQSELIFSSIKINYITFNSSTKAKHFNGDIIKDNSVTAAELLSHTEDSAVIKDKNGKILTGDTPRRYRRYRFDVLRQGI